MESLSSACPESDKKQTVIIVLQSRNAENKNLLRLMLYRNCVFEYVKAIDGWTIASGGQLMGTRGTGADTRWPKDDVTERRMTERNS